jgi:bifunctional non-homologous end joining protein LigD
MQVVRTKSAFIPPCQPTLRQEPPTGERWLHEVKFDGWRAQLHLAGDEAAILSKSGYDLTERFPEIESALVLMPVRAAIIDAEITACDVDGMPDFGALLRGDPDYICVWCFDLLSINDKDLRPLPYRERKARLESLVNRSGDDHIRYSEHFDNAASLLQACSRMKLEGVVSKRADSSYTSGPSKDWIKVKTAQWREANKDRGDLFDKRK